MGLTGRSKRRRARRARRREEAAAAAAAAAEEARIEQETQRRKENVKFGAGASETKALLGKISGRSVRQGVAPSKVEPRKKQFAGIRQKEKTLLGQ